MYIFTIINNSDFAMLGNELRYFPVLFNMFFTNLLRDYTLTLQISKLENRGCK